LIVALDARKRYCLMCGDRPARLLRCQRGGDAMLGAVYCSLVCAAQSAFLSDLTGGLHWCRSCADWHDLAIPCPLTDPQVIAQRGRAT
jgi:hypothetical protein